MIVVIDYEVGNLASITNALNRLKIPGLVSHNISMIRKATGLILPGVGAAGAGMRNLKKFGLDKVIKEEINNGKRFLGICLGMQLLFEKSEEGNVKCLGLLKGEVIKFKKERKVPQIGWNKVKYQRSPASPGTGRANTPGLARHGAGKDQKHRSKIKDLFKDIADNSYFYFVNSYYCIPEDRFIVIGETEYGEKFASLVVKDNITATQFHPEKSGNVGMQFLLNWSR